MNTMTRTPTFGLKRPTGFPPPPLESDLEQRFQRLAANWKRETAHLSSITDMAMHPAYQHIIGMGPPAIPLILRELQQSPDHWFWALNAITEQDPVPEQACGRLDQMTQAWLDWGKSHGYSG